MKRVLAIGGLLLISVSACAFSSGIKGISLSGKVGYSYLLYAKESFRAVTGSPGGFIYGAGAKVDLPYGLFLTGGVDYFKKSGSRVFVSGSKIFRTDIPLTSSILAVTAGGGYQLYRKEKFSPYVGGGMGFFRYQETSQAKVSIPKFEMNKVSFFLLFGLEFLKRSRMSFSVEGRWTYLPNMIGEGGVSHYYGEDNLGGMSLFFSFNYRLK